MQSRPRQRRMRRASCGAANMAASVPVAPVDRQVLDRGGAHPPSCPAPRSRGGDGGAPDQADIIDNRLSLWKHVVMHTRTAHVAIYDTLADWEAGHLLAELRTGRFTRSPFSVVAVAESPGAVTTMGGLRLVPDAVIADLDPE